MKTDIHAALKRFDLAVENFNNQPKEIENTTMKHYNAFQTIRYFATGIKPGKKSNNIKQSAYAQVVNRWYVELQEKIQRKNKFWKKLSEHSFAKSYIQKS